MYCWINWVVVFLPVLDPCWQFSYPPVSVIKSTYCLLIIFSIVLTIWEDLAIDLYSLGSVHGLSFHVHMVQKDFGTYDDSSDSNNRFIIALVINEPPFLRKTGVIPSGPALELFGILLRASFTISVVTSILVKIPCHNQYIVQPDLYWRCHIGV